MRTFHRRVFLSFFLLDTFLILYTNGLVKSYIFRRTFYVFPNELVAKIIFLSRTETEEFQQKVRYIFNNSEIIAQCESLKEILKDISSHLPNSSYLVAKIIYPLVELATDKEEFLQGVKFIRCQILDIQKYFDLDYNGDIKIWNGVVDIPELISIICKDSRNISEFMEKFSTQIDWLCRNINSPILSHQISGNWVALLDEKGRINLKGFFYIGYIKVGESNVTLDGDKALIYLCNNFYSCFPDQKLGKEIIARTFIIAHRISEALGLNVRWAIAYYVKGIDDLKTEDYTGRPFESTQRYDRLNRIFKYSGFRYYYIPISERALRDEDDLEVRQVVRSVGAQYIPQEGGIWIAHLFECVEYFLTNWIKLFYKGRFESLGMSENVFEFDIPEVSKKIEREIREVLNSISDED